MQHERPVWLLIPTAQSQSSPISITPTHRTPTHAMQPLKTGFQTTKTSQKKKNYSQHTYTRSRSYASSDQALAPTSAKQPRSPCPRLAWLAGWPAAPHARHCRATAGIRDRGMFRGPSAYEWTALIRPQHARRRPAARAHRIASRQTGRAGLLHQREKEGISSPIRASGFD